MARLPDIPESLWIADQQQEYERRTGKMWDATQFNIDAQNLEMQIPPDFGHEGGLDQEAEAQRILEEKQAQQEEEQHRIAEGQRQYEAYLAAAKAHEDQLAQASAEASNQGIPSPDVFGVELQGLESRPMWTAPDNASSAVLEGPVGEATPVDPWASMTPGDGGTAPTPPTSLQTADDFDQFAQSLDDHTFGGAVVDAGKRLYENDANAIGAAWDRIKNNNSPEAAQQEVDKFTGLPLAQHAEETFNQLLESYDAETRAQKVRESAGISPINNPESRDIAYEGRENLAELPVIDTTRQLREERGLSPEPTSGELTSPPVPAYPAETYSANAGATATKSALHAPIEAIEDLIDIGLGDPNQEIKHKDSYGIMDYMGLKEGVTKGQVLANVLPLKILNAPQWLDMAAQFVDSPADATAGLALFGAIGKGLESPAGRRLALAVVGGLAGGIDAYVNSRDFTGDSQTGLADVGLEAVGGAAAGFRATKTLPAIPKLIMTIARAPSTAESLRYLDRLAGKVYQDASESIRNKFPAIADGISTPRTTELEPSLSGIMGDVDPSLRPQPDQTLRMPETIENDVLDTGARTPVNESRGKWEVFDPSDGSAVRRFDNEWEANEYASRHDMDYGEINPDRQFIPPGVADRQYDASVQGKQLLQDAVDFTPITGARGALAGGTTGAITGAAAGYNSVPEDAPMDQKLEAASTGWLTGAIAGTPIGAGAAAGGAVGIAKVFQSLLNKGKILPDLFASHPDEQYRSAVALLMAARGKADDELVQLPGIVSFLQKRHPDDVLPWRDMTAGEIRDTYGNLTATRLGRAARDLVVEAISGDRNTFRMREQGADIAAAEGRLPVQRLENNPEGIRSQIDRIGSQGGAAVVQATPDNEYADVWHAVNNVAKELGVAAPRVFIRDSDNVNAFARTGTARLPVIYINRGFITSDITPDEFRGVMIHELAHATDADLGLSLKEQTGQFINKLLGRTEQEVGDIADEVATATETPIARLADVDDEMMAAWGRRQPPTPPVPPSLLNDKKVAMFATGSTKTKLTDAGPIERLFTWVNTGMFDSIGRLQQYQDGIAKEYYKQMGKPIPAALMVAELKRLDPSRAAEQMIDEQFKPALAAFKQLGLHEYQNWGVGSDGKPRSGQDMLDTYLAHTQDLDIARFQGNYANTGQVNRNRLFPGGTNAQEAEKWLTDFEAWQRTNWTAEQRKSFADATQQVWNLGDSILQIKRDAGLIDEPTYKLLREAYPRYIPTKILDYLNDDKAGVAAGKSLSITSNTIKALSDKGTEKAQASPLASLVSATYEAHAAARKNEVFNAFLGLWQEAQAMNTPGSVMNQRAASGVRNARRVEDIADLVMPITSSKGAGNDYIPVQGFIDGVKVKVAVHKDLGDITKFESPMIIPVISGLMQAFRAGATSRNPVFLTANGALDFVNYMIRETARDGGTPQAAFRVLGAYAQAVGDTLIKPMINGELVRHEYSGGAAEFLSKGGGYSGITPRSVYQSRDLFNAKANDSFERNIGKAVEFLGYNQVSPAQEEVRRLQRGLVEVHSVKDIARIVKDIVTLKPVEAIGERVELTPRVAAMRNAQHRSESGLTELMRERDAVRKFALSGQFDPNSPYAHPTIPGRPRNTMAQMEEQIADARNRSDIESTNAGRTVTIDFQKGGVWAKAINQLVPFFNVGVQALADPVRATAENKYAYPITAAVSALGPLYIAEGMNNRDTLTRQDYDDVPQHIKDEGLVLMLPNENQGKPAPVDENGNRHPQFIHLRYRQLAPLAILTREVLQRTIFNGDNQRNIPEILGAMFESVSPLQASDPADLAMSTVPPGLSTALQLGLNRDTFRKRAAISKAADERASPLSVALANRFGWSDYTKHPSWWDFATRDTLSGYAGMWHGASEIMYGEGAKTPQDVPVGGGLYGRFVKGSIGERADQARELVLTDSGRKILEDNKIDWRPTPANQDYKEVDLTRAEYARYQSTLNKYVDLAIKDAAADKTWTSRNRAEKEELVSEYVTAYRKAARGEFEGSITPKEWGVKELRTEEKTKAREAKR